MLALNLRRMSPFAVIMYLLKFQLGNPFAWPRAINTGFASEPLTELVAITGKVTSYLS